MSTYADLMKRRLDLNKAVRSLQNAKSNVSSKSQATSEAAVKAALLASVSVVADLVPGKGNPGKKSLLDPLDQKSAATKRLMDAIKGSNLADKEAAFKKAHGGITSDSKYQDALNKMKSKLKNADKGAKSEPKLVEKFQKLASIGSSMADNAIAALSGNKTGKAAEAMFSRILTKQLTLLGSLDRILMRLIADARASQS